MDRLPVSGGSVPCWFTGKPQVVTRRKATGTGQKKKQDALRAAAEGCAVQRASKAAAMVLKALDLPKTRHAAVSKPNRTGFGANREAPWQSKRDASKAAAEGCAVRRPAKAAARVLTVFRPAQTCHAAISKPNRNSLLDQ